jgi:hypothetical protein
MRAFLPLLSRLSAACAVVFALTTQTGCEEDKVLPPSDPNAGKDGGGDSSDDGGTGGSCEEGEQPETSAKDADCDFNGWWIARQNTESLALGFLPQYANAWYLFELAQDGEQLVVKHHIDCGVEVRGSVFVQLSPETTRALMQHNRQQGRKGTLKKQSDGTCAFEMERFWSVRGVDEATYAPSPRNTDKSIAEVAASVPLPPANKPELTADWDEDGQPGVRWEVSGIANGARHSAQRDWTRYFTSEGYTIEAHTDWPQDLLVRAEFSNEEVVYAADEPTLRQLSMPNAAAKHTLTLRFLGRTRCDARAKAVLKADDFDTCKAIQAALPSIEGLK